MPDKSEIIDVDKSEAIKFLMNKYEIYMKGYEYRDKLVNDIFFRIIHVFQLFLLIIVISGELVDMVAGRNSGYCIICYIIIGFAGLFSLGSLFITLSSLSSSKVETRKQCVKLEAIISDLCPIEPYLPKEKAKAPNLKYWDAINNREKYKWEESVFVKGFEQKNTFRMNVSLIIITIWILIVIIVIIKNPSLMRPMDFIKHYILHLQLENIMINISP
jgi:uncharacterized membrane protein YuzA (DUF378 family)